MTAKCFKHMLYAIAFILLLVVNIPAWLFWFLPMRKKGTFTSVKWDWNCWAFKWDVNNDSDFFKESMIGWWGFVVGSNIVFVDFVPGQDGKQEKHEEAHVLQNYIMNIFFYPLYVLFSGFIRVFLPNLHPYYDNPFEIWARKTAGQEIKIPKYKWINGPNDKWPW